MKNAREVAFEALLRVEKDGAYSNLVLDGQIRQQTPSAKDTAFACALFYGVLERLITLDYALSQHLKQPLKKLKPEALVLLRMGAYQLLYMDKVPANAAVNETVNAAKRIKKIAFASGLINGVLRNLSRSGFSFPEKGSDPAEYYSIYYSFPLWLVKMYIKAYGEENAVGIMRTACGRAPLTVRVNTLRITAEDLTAALQSEGISVSAASCPNALVLEKTGAVEDLSAFKEGFFHVQDAASQLCCMALDAKPGEAVLDLCSAPGGKSFTLAQYMQNKGRLLSLDLYEARAALVAEGAQRLGIECIKAKANDACVLNNELGEFDRVLCDVPCSGLGIIRRKPEIRFKAQAEIDNLPEVQYRILKNAANYVKKGGRLVYSTCTLNPDENEKNVNRFLNEHNNFKLITVLPEVKRCAPSESQTLTLFPHVHGTDGFYISAFERIG